MTAGPEAPHPGAGPTSTGLRPETAAALAYAVWWLSGALMLMLEPRHPFVRFHARQALVGFGVIWLAGVALWAASFLAAFVSPPLFRVLAVLGPVVWLGGLVLWGACVVRALKGDAWALPFTRGG
jgi:uncharacterized membrane protein